MAQTKARQRGIYPEPAEPGYLHPQVAVTINLDAELWGWLKGFVGNNSYFFCVEETIKTALRSMAGKDCESGLSLGLLTAMVSRERRVSAAAAMFPYTAPDDGKAANLLLQAAQLASLGVETVTRFHIPEGEDAAPMLQAWSAVTGRDIAAEIESTREKQEKEDAGTAKRGGSVDRNQSWPPAAGGDLDDDIPF